MPGDFTFCPSGCGRLSQIPSPGHWWCTAANYTGEHEAPLSLPDPGGDLGAVQESCKIAATPLVSTTPLPLGQGGGDVESVASHPGRSGALQPTFACRLGLQEPRTRSWEFKKLCLFINAFNKYRKSKRSWADPHVKVLLFAEYRRLLTARSRSKPPSWRLLWLVTESH